MKKVMATCLCFTVIIIGCIVAYKVWEYLPLKMNESVLVANQMGNFYYENEVVEEKYNKKGHLTSQKRQNTSGSGFVRNEYTYQYEEDRVIKVAFKKNVSNDIFTGTIEFDYNKEDLIQKIVYMNDQTNEKIIYEYQYEGTKLVLEQKTIYLDGEKQATYLMRTYEYEVEQDIKIVKQQHYDTDGNVVVTCFYEEKYMNMDYDFVVQLTSDQGQGANQLALQYANIDIVSNDLSVLFEPVVVNVKQVQKIINETGQTIAYEYGKDYQLLRQTNIQTACKVEYQYQNKSAYYQIDRFDHCLDEEELLLQYAKIYYTNQAIAKLEIVHELFDTDEALLAYQHSFLNYYKENVDLTKKEISEIIYDDYTYQVQTYRYKIDVVLPDILSADETVKAVLAQAQEEAVQQINRVLEHDIQEQLTGSYELFYDDDIISVVIRLVGTSKEQTTIYGDYVINIDPTTGDLVDLITYLKTKHYDQTTLQVNYEQQISKYTTEWISQKTTILAKDTAYYIKQEADDTFLVIKTVLTHEKEKTETPLEISLMLETNENS